MSLSTPPLLPEEQIRRVQQDLRRARRRCGWLWGFLIFSVLLNAGFYTIRLFRSIPHGTEHRSVFVQRYLSGDQDSNDKIAVIRLEGIISSEMQGYVGHDGMVGDIKEQLRLAVEDENVKAIILRIDSPGGEVLASDEIYRAVRSLPKDKPVICSMGSLAASGGYYAAVGSDWIIADDLTITGSIGVIMHTLNYKDLFGKIGLRSYVFKSGKFKDILDGSRDPTQEEMDLVQNLVMETYEQFLQIVAKARGLDAQQLRDGLADGRILSGRQALAAKLVDQTGTFEDAIARARGVAQLSEAQVFDYVVPFSLSSLFGIFAESRSSKIQVELVPQSLKLQNGKLYYLSAHLF